jgi:hypothetical protein
MESGDLVKINENFFADYWTLFDPRAFKRNTIFFDEYILHNSDLDRICTVVDKHNDKQRDCYYVDILFRGKIFRVIGLILTPIEKDV